jgi:hypothetical protein
MVLQNPKSEGRNPKPELDEAFFGFLSDFGVRISGFDRGILLQQPLTSQTFRAQWRSDGMARAPAHINRYRCAGRAA